MNELLSKGAKELAEMIAAGELTSTEVIEVHLTRIAEVDPDVNAVTATLADEARTAAAGVDRRRAKGAALGPLAGVPFTVKENIDVAGSSTTWGVAAMADQVAPSDSPPVARLREAGAIPIARTNLPDFAFRWHTESGRAGHTRNPWDPARTPGGSSGGEAAALATGMTPLGLGNDFGGSLRVPSQMCGTAAIRPSRGRVADGNTTEPSVHPMSIQMTMSTGPMARRVADLRLALEILSAPDVRDPRWVPARLARPSSQEPIRVAVVRDPLGAGVDPQVSDGVDRAAEWLAAAGYEVVDAEPPGVDEAVATWVDLMFADVAQTWPGLEPVAGNGIRAFLEACIDHGVFRPVDQAAQLNAWMDADRLGVAWAAFLQEHPIILSPVSCERPWIVGADIDRVNEIALAMRMVVPVNILGLPACAVPVGVDDGLPQGVQLIGDRFSENLLLDAAEAIEDRAPHLTPIEPRVAVTA
jgi:amidase